MPDRTDGTLRANNSARKHPIGFSSLTRNLERREEKQDFSLNFHENPEIFQATRLRMISQDGSTVTLRFRKFAMFAGNGSAGFSRQFSLSPPPLLPLSSRNKFARAISRAIASRQRQLLLQANENGQRVFHSVNCFRR